MRADDMGSMSIISDSDRIAAFEAAISAAPSPRNRAKVMIEFCVYLDTVNNSEKALTVAREAAAVADQALDPRLVGWALFRQMMALRNLGRLEEVVGLSEETGDQFSYSGDLIGEARVAALLSVVHFSLGDHDEGMQTLVDSAAMVTRTNVADVELVNTLHCQAMAFEGLSAFDSAVAAAERALAIAERLEEPFEAVWALYRLADHLVVWADFLIRGDAGQAEALRVRAVDLIDKGFAFAEAHVDGSFLGHLNLTRGLALIGSGRIEQGLTCLGLAASSGGFGQGAAEQSRLDRALGRAYLESGDLDAASSHLDRSMVALGGTDLFAWMPGTLSDRAEVRKRQGNLAGAFSDLKRALQTAETLRVAEVVGRSKGVIGKVDLELRHLDVTRRELRTEVLQRQAMTDSMTGIPNRRALDGAGTAAAVSNCGCLSVAVVDIDHFKSINDGFGHLTGDAVLRGVGAILVDSVRNGVDLAARYAGDEFVLVLLGVDQDAAAELCERIRVMIAAHAWAEVKPGLAVTVSIGLATGVVPNAFWNLFADADSALFVAKKQGRNRSSIFQVVG